MFNIEKMRQYKYVNDNIWLGVSIGTALPLLLVFIYKLYNPVIFHKHSDKNPFPTFWQDIFTKILILYSEIYYILDSFFTIAAWRLQDACRISFFTHHVICIFAVPYVLFTPYIPWFVVGPPALHAFMLTFPHAQWLNYIYLVIIILFHIGLEQKPWKYMNHFIRMKQSLILLYGTLIGIWWFDCKNLLPDYTF